MEGDQIKNLQKYLDLGNVIEHKNQHLVKVTAKETNNICTTLELVNGKNSKEMNECFHELISYLKMELGLTEDHDIPFELSPMQYFEETTNDVEDLTYSLDTILQALIPYQKHLKTKILTLLNRSNIQIVNSKIPDKVLIESIIGTPCNVINCIGKCIKVQDCRKSASKDGVDYLTTKIQFPRILPPRIYDGIKLNEGKEDSVNDIVKYLEDVFSILSEVTTNGPCLYCAIFNQETSHNPFNERFLLLGLNDFDKNKYILKFFSNLNLVDFNSKIQTEDTEEDEEDTEDESYPFVFHTQSSNKRCKYSKNVIDNLTICVFDNDEYGVKYKNSKIYL